MEQLLYEGINAVRIIHFEGRGDPLMNPDLGELIQLSKEYFPNAVTMITTHATCGLDILRASIDGAFPESYERYRVGGDLNKALGFLRSLRNECLQSKTRMQVIWKYILFEWNDSDEEIRHAARLARELECELRFCMTHTPGRSTRFSDYSTLQRHLGQIGVAASLEETFPLKIVTSDGGSTEGNAAEYVEGFLKEALRYALAQDTQRAVEQVTFALTYDPGLTHIEDHGKKTIRAYMHSILSKARFPLTLSGLAGICRAWEDGESSQILLQQYLELAPDAPDRDHVLQHLALNNIEVGKLT
jgi:wyosine [tRNA(Phe)-imidazoG37] synthetase (radical SAM superfamily)